MGFEIEYERLEDPFMQGVQLMIDEGVNSSWSSASAEYPSGRGVNFQVFVGDIEKIIANLEKNTLHYL